MPEDVMLQEAIEAVRQRQIHRAKDLLTRLLRADKDNPQYWLWMSTVVETVKERIYCLEMALRLDPENKIAKRGMVMFGGMPPDPDLKPTPIIRRKWTVQLEQDTTRRGFLANPWVRAIVFTLAGLAVIGLVLLGIFGTGRRAILVAARPTKTPGPPPTYTATPTYIGYIAPAEGTTTPATVGPTPLWMLLEATYTPTPFYVNTPHPASEAFRAGQLAYSQGSLDDARRFLQQALEIEPQAPDIYYYFGEVERLDGAYKAALKAYNQAIDIDASFAPAYLGRARNNLASDPRLDIRKDLQQAISLDPNLAEAYLERIAFMLTRYDIEAVEKDLVKVEELLPNSPLPHLYRAQLAIKQGNAGQALEAAQQAYELDRTLLPVYLALGEAALMNNDYETASQTLDVYLQYDQKNADVWLALGRAYARLGDPSQVYSGLIETQTEENYQSALEAFDKAIKLDDQLPGAYLYRGLTYLALGEGQKAVNDLLIARQLETVAAGAGKKSPMMFPINLALARGLLAADREDDAYQQISGMRNTAENNEQLAAFYYWRAQILEAVGNKSAAAKDWQALLKLPEDEVSQVWFATAEERVATLTAPTLTYTPTVTRTKWPSLTPTPSRTPLASPSTTSAGQLSPTPTP